MTKNTKLAKLAALLVALVMVLGSFPVGYNVTNALSEEATEVTETENAAVETGNTASEEEAPGQDAEDEAARKAAEDEAARKAAEEEAARKAAEEEAARKAAEEEAARKAAEEEAARKAAEEETAEQPSEESAPDNTPAEESADNSTDEIPQNEEDESGLVEIDDNWGYVDPEVISENTPEITDELKGIRTAEMSAGQTLSDSISFGDELVITLKCGKASDVVLKLYTAPGASLNVKVDGKVVGFTPADSDNASMTLATFELQNTAGRTHEIVLSSNDTVSFKLSAEAKQTEVQF